MIRRSLSWFGSQYSSGDSPGTVKLSSRICCLPPRKDKLLEETTVLKSNAAKVMESFMTIVCFVIRIGIYLKFGR